MNFGSIDIFNRLEKTFANAIRFLKSVELPCKELHLTSLSCPNHDAGLLSKGDYDDCRFPYFQISKSENSYCRGWRNLYLKTLGCWRKMLSGATVSRQARSARENFIGRCKRNLTFEFPAILARIVYRQSGGDYVWQTQSPSACR